ncbi:MAG: 2-C-methyl-D-erythritol 2,4-cyclodiphosphate synthase [Deltaproteobacteria bacterium]|nr:2-C-methyl-D-erythritol 2,4-cyclodiphosphate synthase [Deltaproteobacteria bacterium]
MNSAPNPKVLVIILAAGSSRRCPGSRPKQLLPLAGKPLFLHSVETFHRLAAVERLVIVGPAGDRSALAEISELTAGLDKVEQVIPGGDSRQESVYRGLRWLAAAAADDDRVLIHDGVRPLVSGALIERVLAAIDQRTMVVPVIRPPETVKMLSPAAGQVAKTLEREKIGLAQTPQGACFGRLWSAYRRLAANISAAITDDAHLLELADKETVIRWVEGEKENLKVTYPEDLPLAEFLRRQRQGKTGQAAREEIMVCTGFGYDVHRLVKGRPLVLGGVAIPHHLGLEGHSDADVACHAIVDAILGACAAGDIGRHFPDTDPRYRGADSLEFIRAAVAIARDRGFTLQSIDVTIVAQQPKLAPHLPAMHRAISAAMEPSSCQLNLKATTTERLGFTGREEGIAAYAVVSAARKQPGA